ncbi:hypothetical protein AG1IA_03180 [Rhizoctonia solani AG-1 IA]|uniref:Uncharacterized protein n=1 Tax=Thanatephorus cucumeris (strain AG1-IA) TaxID=983506 RepID=L8WXU7_THACA|nr:hypothetical protein AG1IA_03180 [Rhizoctonia solani AG-1 IA]
MLAERMCAVVFNLFPEDTCPGLGESIIWERAEPNITTISIAAIISDTHNPCYYPPKLLYLLWRARSCSHSQLSLRSWCQWPWVCQLINCSPAITHLNHANPRLCAGAAYSRSSPITARARPRWVYINIALHFPLSSLTIQRPD